MIDYLMTENISTESINYSFNIKLLLAKSFLLTPPLLPLLLPSSINLFISVVSSYNFFHLFYNSTNKNTLYYSIINFLSVAKMELSSKQVKNGKITLTESVFSKKFPEKSLFCFYSYIVPSYHALPRLIQDFPF